MPFLKSSFSPLPAADADLTIALAGNPNVGKSSIFNALTGMHQHTGNWPGKTVDLASGSCCHKGVRMRWVDLPGTYSLSADSPEEEAARDYLCFEQHDAVVVVCDATCLERNLHLLLQVLEITPRVVLCLNLMDEALKKGIRIDTNLLSQKLGIPVVRTSARTQMGLTELTEAVQAVSRSSSKKVLLPPFLRSSSSSTRSRKHPPCCWMSCLPHWFAAASSCVMPVFLFRPPPIFHPTEYRTTVRPTGWTDCFSAAGPASL